MLIKIYDYDKVYNRMDKKKKANQRLARSLKSAESKEKEKIKNTASKRNSRKVHTSIFIFMSYLIIL